MANVSAATHVEQIKAVLLKASKATGTDFDYMLRTAQRESSLRPDAKAPTSSATGLFQFIDQTWLATLKKSGEDFGYGKYADAITRMPGGRYKVTDPSLNREIFALRKDPMAASLMAGAYTRDAAETLSSALDRTPLKGELYVAHFLGPGGAVKLIQAAETTPNRRAAELFPQAARANRPAFYTKTGAPRTALQLYEKLISIYGPGKATFAEMQTAAVAKQPATAKQPAAIDALQQAAQPAAPVVAAAIEPASASFRLASHFQNVRGEALGSLNGRPFQSLFATDGKAVAPGEQQKPPTGPLVIIPDSVRNDSGLQITPAGVKYGAVEASLKKGPLNIIPKDAGGLLQKRAPMLSLFQTDTLQT